MHEYLGLEGEKTSALPPNEGVATVSQTNLMKGMEHTVEANLVAAHAAAAIFAPHVFPTNGEDESMDSEGLARLRYRWHAALSTRTAH